MKSEAQEYEEKLDVYKNIHTGAIVKALELDEDFKVADDEGITEFKAGDFLYYEEGDGLVVSREEFLSEYYKVTD